MSEKDIISVLDGRVKLRQPDGKKGFRTSMDSVLLAAACPAQSGQRVLDIGCGVGSAGLCVTARVPACHLAGIDIQAELVSLASENAALNNVHAAFHVDNILEFHPEDAERFDHVICNPPFFKKDGHYVSPDDSRAKALGLVEDSDLKDWIDCAFYALHSRGTLTLIHQAQDTDEIIRLLGKRFGAIEIIPIFSKPEQPAHRVIIRAIKDRRSPCTLQPGVTMHYPDGRDTEAATTLLRGGDGLYLR